MELDVKRVGLQSCFVALPPSLLEILLADKRLPSFPFVIELRPVQSLGESSPCFVAWDGAASTSTNIEVPEALAECIGLPTGARVRVRARGDVVAAETVIVEPATEDDWEILELNAEYLENNILSKVGVVSEGQQFPVWVTGQVVLTLRVISTSPKGIVKLVPGAELVVAPKKRQVNKAPPAPDVGVDEPLQQDLIPGKEAWLRVQELHASFVKRLDLAGITCSTTPSTAVFVSSSTAKVSSFEDGQLVVLNSGKGQTQPNAVGSNGKHNGKGAPVHRQRGERDGVSDVYEDDVAELESDTQYRDAVVRLKFWEGVAPGHVMVGLPLRVFIGATIHMPVLLQATSLKNSVKLSALALSPVLFQPVEDDDSSVQGRRNGLDASATSRSLEQEVNEIHTKEGSKGMWQGHRHVLNAISGFLKEGSTVPEKAQSPRLSSLLMSWLDAQVAFSGALLSEETTQDVPISGEAIIHLVVAPVAAQGPEKGQLGHKFAQSSSMPEVFLNSQMNRASAKNLLFLLSAFSDIKGGAHDGRQPTADRRKLSQQNEDLSLANVLLRKEMLGFQVQAPPQKDKVAAGPSVNQGLPCHLPCISGMNLEVLEGPGLASLTWLDGPASTALGRLQVLLCPTLRFKLKQLGAQLPGSVLLHGPSACGKTQLALALAQELQDDQHVLSHRVLVGCGDLVGEQVDMIRRVLKDAVREAIHHSPSLIILDDLDVLLPASESEGPEPGIAVLSIAEFLADLMDVSQGRRTNEFDHPAIAFLAVAKSSTALPACLCFSGRFDFHVQLTAPAASERAAILTQIVTSRGLRCSESVAATVAANCEGGDASDMELLVDRAVHAAASRFLSSALRQLPSQAAVISDGHMASGQEEELQSREGVEYHRGVRHVQKHFELLDEDFQIALKDFVPLGMRGVTKAGTQVAHMGWGDVGGLYDTRVALQEMLEMPVKYSKIYEQAPLRLRTGVLLYGPPGCGKTHIVGAAAAACSLRLISVKGPELLNKYIGASEQGVRDVFARAAAAAPCILFFDEFDAIAPQRGHDNTGVTDRVVNQLLTELDGVEALNGVFVFAATSRPDLLDAALLRPGRLDRLLICDFPSARERFEILQVLARKLPLADDVDLDQVASLTDGFSAADLQAVLSDAQLESVHAFLDRTEGGIQETQTDKPLIAMTHLRETAIKARPSVPDNERRRLNRIYDAFIGAKRSLPSKVDIKGKRATLA